VPLSSNPPSVQRPVLMPNGIMKWSSTPRRGKSLSAARPQCPGLLPPLTSRTSKRDAGEMPVCENDVTLRPGGRNLRSTHAHTGKGVLAACDSERIGMSTRCAAQPTHQENVVRDLHKQKDNVHVSYTSESSLFERYVQESISSRMPSSQMQYLLGVSVRAEPLWAEVGFGYLGAANLPVTHNFLNWDSTLDAVLLASANWPCSPMLFSAQALGGTKDAQREPCGPDTVRHRPHPLMNIGRVWPTVDENQCALALGPRLLRIRRLENQPSLGLAFGSRRCANSAFCGRTLPAARVGGEAVGSGYRCEKCTCAWYCSSACQAVHHTAHSFECKALHALQSASALLKSKGLEKNKKILLTFLENVLAKQLSMVARVDALLNRSAVTQYLQHAVQTGAWSSLDSSLPRAPSPALSDASEDNGAAIPSPDLAPHAASSFRTAAAKPVLAECRFVSPVIGWSQMVLTPASHEQWEVELQAAIHESRYSRHEAAASASSSESLRYNLFTVHHNQAHSAAGIVHLMNRWVSAGDRFPALRDVINEGLVFSMVTGISQTQHFAKRTLRKNALVSVLSHRMALHIAASQEYEALSPSLQPPKQLQEQGLQGIEMAQYTAYYAFFNPIRLPFFQLRPLLPVICVAWGEEARDAMMSFPVSTD